MAKIVTFRYAVLRRKTPTGIKIIVVRWHAGTDQELLDALFRSEHLSPQEVLALAMMLGVFDS